MPHLYFIKSASVLCLLVFLYSSASAQTSGFFFEDKSSFQRAVDRTRTIDFESVAPPRGFGKYAPAVGLTIEGISFRTHGGAKFGSGTIYVPSRHYIAGNPGLRMLDGAHLAWGAPNQPGNAYLELSFPGGVHAFGTDMWASQPVISPVEIAIVTRDGATHTHSVTTRGRPESTFTGFVSALEISSIRFTIAKGQSSLLLDNLVYGKHAASADLTALSRTVPAAPDVTERTRPEVSAPDSRRPARPARSVTSDNRSAHAAPVVTDKQAPSREPGRGPTNQNPTSQSGGSIAYVRNGKEIRLISPDGSNDRRLWTHSDAHEAVGINELAWSPDGSELAFSSGHESVASFYHADIFSIKPNGTGVRKITNGPDRSDFPKYGKGTVTVTIRNEQPIYQTTKASTGIFFVYVVGADLPQPLTLPPGSSRTLTFKNVADFGDHAQAVVAIYGSTRWFIPGTDVKAGKVVKAPDFGISGNGLELFGAFRPVWKRDGSRISYRSGLCIVSSASARTNIGHTFDPIFKGEDTPAPCAWDWGPTAETAEHLLYSVTTDEEIQVYRLNGAGGRHPGEKLATFSKEKYQFVNDLRWLPDGSGFLFSGAELGQGAGNILRYDLASRRTTPVTTFDETFAKAFTISPDGRWVVFERTNGFVDDESDLWIIGIDGKGLRLLTKDANHPAWGR